MSATICTSDPGTSDDQAGTTHIISGERFSSVDSERQNRPELPPRLAELSEKMSKPPASVNKGILISALLPGMGEAYHGNVDKGIRILIEYAAAIVLSVLTSASSSQTVRCSSTSCTPC